MTTALAGPSVTREAPRLLDPDALAAPARRRPTLEATVLEASRELRLRGSTGCLVCGEPVDATGECRSCGSTLG